MKNKKIFVTGGTGSLGSYLLRYLVKQGHTNVWAMRRATSDMTMVEEVKDKVHWVEGDILDVPFLEDVLEDVSEVYHSAALISYAPKDVDRMMKVNAEGTANIVNVCLYRNVGKLLHVSSISAIGKKQKSPDVSEENKWDRSHSNSNYGISKYLAEQEVWRGMAEGLNVVIVNPSVILGSANWHTGPARLFKQVWDGLKFYTEGTTGFVDVRDVARFMIQLMESDITGERYILNGDNLTFKTVFTEIAQAIQKAPPSIKVNQFIQGVAWRLGWIYSKITGRAPMVTKETASAAMSTYYYHNDKSLTAFNFKYTPVLQTIQETGNQFLEATEDDLKPRYLPLR